MYLKDSQYHSFVIDVRSRSRFEELQRNKCKSYDYFVRRMIAIIFAVLKDYLVKLYCLLY